MPSTRSHKLGGSLGNSWGDADYSEGDDASIHSASEFTDPGSESEVEEEAEELSQCHSDITTPLPPKNSRASSKPPRHTPNSQTQTQGPGSRNRHSPSNTPQAKRSNRSAPGSMSSEPSFIMPSMSGPTNDYYTGSPLRNSQMRARTLRRPKTHNQSGDYVRAPNRRVSGNMPSLTQVPPKEQQEQELGPWYYVNLFLQHFVWPVANYSLEVFGYMMKHFMKPLLAILLAAFVLLSVLPIASGLLFRFFHTALTPICILPGSSYVVPFCATEPQDIAQADFEEVVNIQDRFGDVVDLSKETFGLPPTMKRSESVMRDVRTLVKHSRLPSKAELEVELGSFIQAAQAASSDLTKYNAKLVGTVDNIMATNSWTMNVLEGLTEESATSGTGSGILNAVTGAFVAPSQSLQRKIFDQYLHHVAKNKQAVSELIGIAEGLTYMLRHSEERLDIIFDIATRDGLTVTRNKDELLSLLWTKLGGNASTRKEYERQLALLQDVTSFRRKAVDLLSGVILKLQAVQADLEKLREDVAAPEVLGWRDEVPLSYHIDVVNRGIDRLRVSRQEIRDKEVEYLRGTLSGNKESQDRKELPPGKQAPRVYT